MLTDIKLSKAQLSKIILSGGFNGALLGKLTGPLIKVSVSLAKKFFVSSATMAFVFEIDISTQR